MTSTDWAGVLVSFATLIGFLAASVRWLTKHYFEEIKHELKPNGGGSMKDQVNKLEKDICDLKAQNQKGEEYHEKLDKKIDHLTEVFIDYVSKR